MRNRVGLLVLGILFVPGGASGAAEDPDSISPVEPLAGTLAMEPPVAVSPGAETEVVLVAGRCPVFSWGSVEGARRHELVVYAFDESSGEVELDPSAMRKVLKVGISGGASVWTPPLAQCLESGGSYAWMVRARTEAGWTDWSEVRLFRVDPGPSTADVERALETLSRFLAARGVAPSTAEAVAKQGLQGSGGKTSTSKRPTETQQVIDTGNAVDTALRAESAAASGKTFGIHGISTSADPESAGMVGDATSAEGFGGIFKNNAADGAGLLAVGGSENAADIVLGATVCGAKGGKGRIDSDPACLGSDIHLRANDAVVVQIGENQAEDGNFVVSAVQDSDGTLQEVFNVDESGEILVGIANTSRTKLTKNALMVNASGDAGDQTFNIFNSGTGDMTLRVDGVNVVTGGGTPQVYERMLTTGSGGSWDFGNVRLEANAINHQIAICNETAGTRYFVLSRSGTIETVEITGGGCETRFIGGDHWFQITGAHTHIVGVGQTASSVSYDVVAISAE